MSDEKLTPPEFTEWLEEVLQFGIAKGYGKHSWKEGIHFNHRDNHSSMWRHLAESYCGTGQDHESGLHPLKHVAVRALMQVWFEEQSEISNKLKKSFEE